MIIRKYEPNDRQKIISFFQPKEAIDTPENTIYIADNNGTIEGASMFSTSKYGDPRLEAVNVSPFKISTYMQLVAEGVKDLINAGYENGYFQIYDKGLLDMLKSYFQVKDEPHGRNPITGEAKDWIIRVDLKDALAQLQKYI